MSKNLTVYFSAEGNTAALAKRIAEASGSDIFEIRPEIPYTKSDINWKNPLSRCNKEKIGKKDIPIAGRVEGFKDYSTVFVGFPIWYYGAPNIINSFMQQYDWTGKRIALFATSGGSDIGKTVGRLRPYVKGDCRIIAAKVFASGEDAAEWVGGIVRD